MFDGQTTSEEVIEAFKPQIKGKTFVLIGASYPRGSPAHILIASRTAAKVEPVLKTIAEIDSAIKNTYVQVDTTDHDSVREAAPKILAAAPRIDVLQGIEFQQSANHVGGFLLTNLLMPALLATAAGAGGRRGLTATVVDPGYNGDTKLGAHLTGDDYGLIDGAMRRNRGYRWDEPRFKTFSQIAATSLIAALDPRLPEKSPAFLQNSQVHEPEEHAKDPESVDRL
ncbi:NAD(P)-binding protein [Xylaria palmicola]|nr:NAD(P)-binding protein [Xylaria palmicola]